MKGVSVRNSGKFSQSIQCLFLGHFKGKKERNIRQHLCYKTAASLTWCRTADLYLPSRENLQEIWKILELSQTRLTSPSSVYLQRYCSRDRPFRETNTKKEIIRIMWQGSLMTSHTSLFVSQCFKAIISMWKTEPSHFVCCRFQCAKTVVCSNINHQDPKNSSLCL